MENNFVFMQLSSLEKVFLDDDISRFKKFDSVTALKNERVSYQILYSGGNQQKNRITYKFNADRRLKITVRNVGYRLNIKSDKKLSRFLKLLPNRTF